MSTISIISFYKFEPVLDIEKLKHKIENICETLQTKGTILIAPEGINGTIEGSQDSINKFIKEIKSDERFFDLDPKYSYNSKDAFHRMKVRLKKEIVTIGNTDINPNKEIGKYCNNWKICEFKRCIQIIR